MAAIQYPPLDSPSTARTLYTSTPWTDPSGGQWLWSVAKGRWSPVAESGGGASVSDTAYDATSWNGVTDEAPSKNAVRDKFESLPTVTVVDAVTNGDANAVSSNAVFDVLALKAPLASPTFTGPVDMVGIGEEFGATISSDIGIAALIFSDSGTGAGITSGSGTYHTTFGDTGIDQSFVARLKGAFGWIRGERAGRIHPPDTLVADRTWELPDASGTLALTSDINTLAKLDTIVADATLARTDAGQAFEGLQQFSTRPQSSAAANLANTTELLTRAESDVRHGEQIFGINTSEVSVSASTAFVDVVTITLPPGTYRLQSAIGSVHDGTSGCYIQVLFSSAVGIGGMVTYGRNNNTSSAIQGWSASATTVTRSDSGATTYRMATDHVITVASTITAKLQYSQLVSNAAASVCQRNAWILAQRVA